MNKEIIKAKSGTRFNFGPDEITIKVSSKDAGGAYSLMHWVVAPNAYAAAHVHEDYEETFYVLSGRLDFLIGDHTTAVEAGDFIRAPKGTRHGYTNPTNTKVELLVTFTPGGMEQLFEKHQFDGTDIDGEAFLKEARDVHKTEYEIGT